MAISGAPKAPGRPSRRLLRLSVVNIQAQPGHHPHHRQAGEGLNLGKSRAQKRHIPPELVDNKTSQVPPLPVLQQGGGAVEAGEDPAPVDIPHQQHRGPCQPGHPHVDDVVFLEVDFRRAPRPLDNHHIVLGGQAFIGPPDAGEQLRLAAVVFGGGHVPPNLAVYNHLAAGIALGL